MQRPLDPLVAAFSRRDRLTEEEKAILEGLPKRLKDYKAGADIIAEGSRPQESCLVLEGFTARAQHLSSGKTQLTAVHISGDFVDLHGFLLKQMDHGIVALSPCKVAFIPHASLRTITETNPHLARMFWLSTVVDGAIQRAWITCLGRRSAIQHLAHLICELYLRLEIVGQAENGKFEFPVTQSELGDMLGLSNVHVNRTLQELRSTQLIRWRGSTVHIDDFDRLRSFAEFDPLYLNLTQEPR